MLTSAMPPDYVRTRIARLQVSGYRSLYDVELDDLPDIVVFHGKNGTGKSNLMRVPSLVLGWAAVGSELPTADKRLRTDYEEASRVFGIRSTDFSHGRAPELRIELVVELGTVAGQLVDRVPRPLGRLELDVRVQDVGGAIELWFESTTLNDSSLVRAWDEDEERRRALLGRLKHALRLQGLIRRMGAYRSIEREPLFQPQLSPPEDASGFQRRMYAIHIDPDLPRRRQLKHVARRLAELGVFAGDADVELSPAEDRRFGECRLYVRVPAVGDVPIENLGTGQQQLIMMAAEALVHGRPIIQLEEPEAHLHAGLMETFARFLKGEAETASEESPIDQVWISTHHHAFAIAPEYFEVEHDPVHGTTVQRRDRAHAAKHFYEPGPLWEALRSLANSAPREAVVMHDGRGRPVTAGEILDSIDGDRQLANEFAAAATRTIVKRFRKEPVEGA